MTAHVEERDHSHSMDESESAVWNAFRQRARDLLRSQRDRVRSVEASLSADVAELARQLDQEQELASHKQEELQLRIDELEQRNVGATDPDAVEALLEEARVALSQSLEEQSELRAELNRCQQLLEAQQDQLPRGDTADTPQAATAGTVDAAADELRERYEMALDEIRDLKSHNEALASQLTESRKSLDAGSSSSFDWEAQKQQLMRQLDSDYGESESQERLTIEETIRVTDQIVAERDREITELRRLVEELENAAPQASDPTHAAEELLDSDEIIRQERETLRELQKQWEEKLRQAEVEVSVERAKLARERQQLEETLQSLESARPAQSTESEPDSDSAHKKTPRGNWLARLGLTDNE